jgi:hypothetical protein
MSSILVLAAAAALGVPQYPDFEWQGAVARGAIVEIRGVTGDIHAVSSSSGVVEVAALILRDGVEEPVDVRVNKTPAGVTVCAVRSDQSACPAVETAAAPGARVNYFVRIPRGVNLAASTVNGSIDVDSLHSNVAASTVNGGVNISTTGTAKARTVNGSIRASLLKPFWSQPPEFSTVNGGITLAIPTGSNALVKAETRNGKIVAGVSAFKGSATEQTLEGKIGRGGADPMTLRSINGTIELRENF